MTVIQRLTTHLACANLSRLPVSRTASRGSSRVWGAPGAPAGAAEAGARSTNPVAAIHTRTRGNSPVCALEHNVVRPLIELRLRIGDRRAQSIPPSFRPAASGAGGRGKKRDVHSCRASHTINLRDHNLVVRATCRRRLFWTGIESQLQNRTASCATSCTTSELFVFRFPPDTQQKRAANLNVSRKDLGSQSVPSIFGRRREGGAERP